MKKVSKLKFKGDSSAVATTKKRKTVETESGSSSSSSAHQQSNEDSSHEDNFEPQSGTGRLTSSSTIVSGHYTKFMDELHPGDAIIVTHPTSLVEEMKVVRIVVSNISMSISSAFSTDLISTTPFRFIKAPKDESKAAQEASSSLKVAKQDSEEAAFGTYASAGGEKFVYRVKKTGSFGGYKIVTESTADSLKNREQLLDMRSKKKSDRFCY